MRAFLERLSSLLRKSEPEWITAERKKDRRRLNRILLYGEPLPHNPTWLWRSAARLGNLWSRGP